ncbi:phage protein NinX family protein [Rahnella woolbedingensis]|uniref:DUF2591 domain-containing protein n=1 Tax=Rahnella woolbedingensis TaxID=1510574 RepID=A0A419NEL4_9GAMM|nr:phage protein NinX family protein [Rahnella woolbedingensis]RJT47219.1 DUF2591 domain-containing protein [Rahnella woolbedingensis]
MKDYSAMSDDEIAMEIFLLNLCESARKLAISRGMNHHDVLRGGGEWSKYDPCNNPADAWPIIMANHIGIMPFKSGAATAWPTSIGLLSNFHVKHENPLRAAMICYLMMKDAGKCYG